MNVRKDKQQSTKHTRNTKDRVTRTTQKTGSEPGCSLNYPAFYPFEYMMQVILVLTYISTHEDIDTFSRFLNPSTSSDIKEVA